jgi:tRNA dimethylallyltransferase
MSLDDAVEQIKIATRQLARRQMKWFKRFTNVNWLPGDVGEPNIAAALAILQKD